MIDIEKLKSQIVKALMPLNPDKIILFASCAYGTPNDNNLSSQNIREYELKACHER